MTTGRQGVSIYDYPEHLNPFHEDESHSKLRFWELTRKKTRSNSFTFQSIKDFRPTLSFRSKKRSQTNSQTSSPTPVVRHTDYTLNRPVPSNRQTLAVPNRYVNQGSITPLPRSRFHERVRNSEPENHEVSPGVNRRRISLSELSNPFETVETELRPTSALSCHSGTTDSSTPKITIRKKKKAPPPPLLRNDSIKDQLDVEATIQTSNDNQVQVVISSNMASDISEQSENVIKIEDISKTETESEIINHISTKSENSTIHDSKDNLDITGDHLRNPDINASQKLDEINASEDISNKSDHILTKSDITVDEFTDNVSTTDKTPKDTSVKTEIVLETYKNEQKEASDEDITVNILASNSSTVLNTEEVSNCVRIDSETLDNHLINDGIGIVNENQMKLESEEKHEIADLAENASENCNVDYNLEYIMNTENASVTPANSEESLNYHEQTIDDATAELQEIVHKLHLEVNKLTNRDDTNNNLILSNGENNSIHYSSRPYQTTKESFTLGSSSGHHSPRAKTDISAVLSSNDSTSSDSECCSNPRSPKLVRLRKDDAWIKN